MTEHNLRSALHTLGEGESGTARLKEAVVAYREALKERTREGAPLEWATSFGGEGVALMLPADLREDAPMAETALSQILTAFETARRRRCATLQPSYLECLIGENWPQLQPGLTNSLAV
jgi:hypothetical protein